MIFVGGPWDGVFQQVGPCAAYRVAHPDRDHFYYRADLRTEGGVFSYLRHESLRPLEVLHIVQAFIRRHQLTKSTDGV